MCLSPGVLPPMGGSPARCAVDHRHMRDLNVETFRPGESSHQPTEATSAAKWLGNGRIGSPKFWTATALTALAGFNDAVGYSALGHLYLSFMSGNSTHFGMSLASADGTGILLAGSIILSFVLGSAVGTAIGDRFPQSMERRILAVELAIVLWAVVGSQLGAGAAALVPVAGAMGMQNVLHQLVRGVDVGKGFITGSLFGLGQSLARVAMGQAQGAAAFQNGWSWVSFVTGVSVGATVFHALGLPSALGAVAIALAAMVCWLGAGRSQAPERPA